MRSLVLLLLLPLLTACGAMQAMLQGRQDLSEIGAKVDGLFGKVDEKLDAVRGEVVGSIDELAKKDEQNRKQADLDGDGVIAGMDEKTLYLLLSLAGVAEMGRRKLKGQDAKLAEAEARIEWEREKRKDAEVARLKELAGAPKA